ncbi:MAG: hypothetical protein PHW50_00060 [Patescibacteria group bacterium]|nr:hypothetical protein [Patescibacteria group bacterium]
MNESEPQNVDDGKQRRLARITELISLNQKTNEENAEMQRLLAEQKKYERETHKEEYRCDPLTQEEQEELKQLRKEQIDSGNFDNAKAKRLVELNNRLKYSNRQ